MKAVTPDKLDAAKVLVGYCYPGRTDDDPVQVVWHDKGVPGKDPTRTGAARYAYVGSQRCPNMDAAIALVFSRTGVVRRNRRNRSSTTVQRSPRIPAALSFKIPDLGRNDKNDAAPGPYLRPANMTDGRHRREMEERGLLGFDGEFSTTLDTLKKVVGDIGMESLRARRRRVDGELGARGKVYIANKRHVTAELIEWANHEKVDVYHDGRRA